MTQHRTLSARLTGWDLGALCGLAGAVMVQTSDNDQASGRQDPKPHQYRDALWAGVLKSLGGLCG